MLCLFCVSAQKLGLARRFPGELVEVALQGELLVAGFPALVPPTIFSILIIIMKKGSSNELFEHICRGYRRVVNHHRHPDT